MSGNRLVAGDGGEGVEGSDGFLPSKFGRFSNISDLGLVGSGDIKLKSLKLYRMLFFILPETYSCCELLARESAKSLSGSAEGVSCSRTPRDG